MRQHTTVTKATGYWLDGWGSDSCHCVHNGSRAYAVSHPMGTSGSVPGFKAKFCPPGLVLKQRNKLTNIFLENVIKVL